MIDIGPSHRREYELGSDQSERVVIGEAPGRLHYLGEHGEPQGGLFLSSAINRYVRVAVSARKDNSLRFYAGDLGERKRTTLMNLKYKREDRWANYIKAVVFFFVDQGYPVKGLNWTITGDIPQQIGFASSQAIEMASLLALKSLLKAVMGEKDLISRFIGARSVFFEQETSPVDYLVLQQSRKDQFLLTDEATREVKRVKSPLTKYKLIITDSRVPRLGVEDELRQRTQDILKGRELLSGKKEGAHFRDYASGDLVDSIGNLPEQIRRRSLHIVQEIHRVNEAWDALQRADIPAFSRIIFHSQEGLRDLYEVSCPEIDWLVKRAQEIEGVGGSRMTGRGFGGCTYTFIREVDLGEYRKRLDDYERIFGFHPFLHEMKPGTGARLIPE